LASRCQCGFLPRSPLQHAAGKPARQTAAASRRTPQLIARDLDPWIWDSLYPKGAARELPDE
jgi:hypothetical protein